MAKNNSETKDLPKYLWLKQKIKRQIESGELKPEGRVPSENELVHTYGLSNNTVQKTFTHLLLEGYIYREQGKGTFVKKPLSKEINVQVVCDDSSLSPASNPIYWFISYYILQGIIDGCNKFNCRVSFADPSSKNPLTNKSQGIIMVKYNPELVKKLKEKGYIVVVPYRIPPDVKCNKVITDFEKSAYDGIIYLINLSHKRIGFIGDTSDFSQGLRWLGYKKALEKRNIPFEQELTIECGSKIEDGYQAMLSLLRLKRRPTAVFASTDLRALGAIKAIKEKELRVPEDIAMLSYDDIPESSSCKLPLTTLHPPRYECGYEAVKLLKQLIKKEKKEPQTIILPTKLIVRKSCGAYLKKQLSASGGFSQDVLKRPVNIERRKKICSWL